MTNKNLGNMNRQRGHVLILVLIVLAVGSLLITPMLRYVFTGLKEADISKELLLKQYAADAGVEYSLWQLKYNVDGLTDQLSPENPSCSTSITVNGIDVPVTTEISQSPQSGNGSFTIPPPESGIHLAVALEITSPSWSGSGQIAYLTHIVSIYNYGTSAVHLKALLQQLDPYLEYVSGSYEGPNAELTKTYVNDHWELHFDFREPLPRLGTQEAMFITFIASAEEDMGEHAYSGSGEVSYAGFEEEEVLSYSGESGTAAFGLYDLTITIGSYTVLVNVGITEEGEIIVRSWQIQ